MIRVLLTKTIGLTFLFLCILSIEVGLQLTSRRSTRFFSLTQTRSSSVSEVKGGRGIMGRSLVSPWQRRGICRDGTGFEPGALEENVPSTPPAPPGPENLHILLFHSLSVSRRRFRSANIDCISIFIYNNKLCFAYF